MQVKAPGVFEVLLADGPREIKVSLGLKGEIYKKLVRKQLEYQQLAMKNLIDDEDKRRISDLADEISIINQGDDAERLERVRRELDAAYVQAFSNLEHRQKEFMHELALGKVTLTEDSIAETLAMLLSKWENGRITEPVTADQIKWDDAFFEAQDELMALLDAVIEYLDETLKKTPQFNRMLENLVDISPSKK